MRVLLVVVCALVGCERGELSPPTPRAAHEADASPSSPKPMSLPVSSSPCIARYSFDGDSSVLDEQRRRGGAARWDDFAKTYPAAYLDPETDHPVEVVESFRIGDTPLLWFRADFSEAVVNAAVLDSLTVVDGTSLRPGQREAIGALTELGRGKLAGRELAHFLLRADAIHSYLHIGSSVCLIEEEDEGGRYRGRFSGEHVYFTNEENRDSFGFWIVIDAVGKIFIEGAEALPLPPAVPSSK